jgi:hypothetical protein
MEKDSAVVSSVVIVISESKSQDNLSRLPNAFSVE